MTQVKPARKKRESEIEKYLDERVTYFGGKRYKFVSPGKRGVPDNIVVLPYCPPFFVEVKNEDGRLSPSQTQRVKELRDLGAKVYVVSSEKEVDEIL